MSFLVNFYTIEDNDKISDNCKYPLVLIQASSVNKSSKYIDLEAVDRDVWKKTAALYADMRGRT